MQELINLIQSGDLTNNQILQRITTIHDQNCDETDEAIECISALEAKDTLNQIVILELKSKLEQEQNKLIAQTKELEKGLAKETEMAQLAQKFQNKLAITQLEVQTFKQMKADNKKLKPQVKRLKQANTNAAKRNIKHMQEKKAFRLQRDRALLECAKITMTGFKKVGKYTFSLFPVKVVTEDGGAKIGLSVANDNGCLKVLTRTDTGEVIQPKSHNFKFNQTECGYIDEVFDLIEKGNHVFTNELLRFVK